MNYPALSPKIAEQLKENPRVLNLQIEVIEGLQKNKYHLVEIGVFPLQLDHLSESQKERFLNEHIEWEVDKTFKSALQKKQACKNRADIEAFFLSKENKAVNNLLILSGVARCIVATDWSVERTLEGSHALGVHSFSKIEEVWEKKYGKYYLPPYKRVDKGPGNCINSHLLSNEYVGDEKTMRAQHWLEEGIGDNLYFSIESLLNRFYKPEIDTGPASYKFQVFKRYLGLALRRALRNKWYKKADNSNIYTWETDLPFFDLNDIFSLLAKPAYWIKELWKEKEKKFIVSCEFEDDCKDPIPDGVHRLLVEYKENGLQFLEKIFTEEFFNSLRFYSFYDYPRYRKLNTHGDFLDLNQYPQIYWEYFIRGDFSEILDKFEKESIHIETDIRASSHDKNFKVNLIKSIDALAPGGYILTEGAKQSYSRILRLHEIYEITQRRSDLHVDVILDKQSYSVRSILIQKKHPEEGFLSEMNKREMFADDVYWENIENIIERPDIKIANDIRRRLKAISRIQLDIFKGRHDKLERWLEVLILDRAKRNFNTFLLKSNLEPERLDTIYTELNNLSEEDEQRVVWTLALGIEDCKRLDSSVFTILKEGIATYFGASADNNQSMYYANDNFFDYPSSTMGFSKFIENMRLSPQRVSLLTKNDIEEITNELASKISNTLNGDSVLPFTVYLEAVGTPEDICIFKRVGDSTRLISCKNISRTELPSNAFFESDAWDKQVEMYKHSIFNSLDTLNAFGIQQPIELLCDSQCITNDFLQKWLQDILQSRYDSDVHFLELNFQNLTPIGDYARDFYGEGKCLIAGGSWQDAYKKNGGRFKSIVGKPIVSLLENPESLFTGIFICFSYEVIADIIGEKYCNNQIVTVSGPLEMGPTPIVILDPNHPLLKGVPNFTATMTHSGHVLNTTPGHEERTRHERFLRPLALSGMTGIPAIAEAFQGKALLIQPHLELDIVENGDFSLDTLELMDEIQKKEFFLKRDFNINSSAIMHNLKNGLASLQGNPKHLLTRALALQLQSLAIAVAAKHPTTLRSTLHTVQ